MGKCNHRIRRQFRRPPAELLEKFRDIPVANIDDAMGRMASMSSSIHPYGLPKMLGPAFTIKVPYGDNLMLHEAIELVQAGDVIVIQSGESMDRAIFGGLLVRELRGMGVAGIVVDGAIRDAEEIAAFGDFPVYARCTSPNGPYKNGPGEINYPVAVGGQVVCPGDIICGDGDGVLVIPQDQAEEVLADALQIVNKEALMLEQISHAHLDRAWVHPKLEELGIAFE